MPVPIVVTTSDSYLPALRPYAWLVEKYWPNPAKFYIVGFAEPDFPLPERFKFVSVGKQEDYPLEKWTDALLDFLSDFNKELFILMLEDYWVTRPVNTEAIELAKRYMESRPNVLKFDLTADRLHAHGVKLEYDTAGWLDVILSDPDSPYHMSLMAGMWRKELFTRVVRRGWNPWDVELEGTNVLKGMRDMDVVGSKQWPIKHTLAFRSGDASKLLLNEIKQEDMYSLKRLGYLAHWGVR